MAETLQPLTGRRRLKPPRPHQRRGGLLRRVPALTLALFLVPVAAGLIGTWLPAFGYFPALGGETLSLEPWRQLFTYPGLAGSLRLTLTSGLLATILSLAITVAFVAGCHGQPLFRRTRRFLAPLLAMPHVAIAIGFAFLIAPSGWILRLIVPWAVDWPTPPDVATVQDPYGLALTFGLVIKEVPYLLLMTLAALNQTHAEQRLTVARSLGYGPAMAWLKTVLPAVYPQIRLPVYAVLAFSLSVVDVAVILAPTTPPPLAVLVFRWFNNPDLAQRFVAAAGASLQIAIVVAAIAAWRGLECLVARWSRRWLTAGSRGGDGRGLRLAAGIAMRLVLGSAAGSLLAIALWSFTRRWRYPDALPSAWSTATWTRHGYDLFWTGWTTLALGMAAAVLALILVIGCLENEQRHGLKTSTRGLCLLYMPLLVPQVGFLFGAQVLAVQANIDGTWLALIWSHLLFVLPYVFLSLADPYRALDERYARSALCLGATPNRVFWRVKLPMLLRPILFALAIGFAVSVAQYLPTMFAGAGRFATLTTEAVSLAGSADRRVMGVYAFLQSLFPLLVFATALALPAWLFRRRRDMTVVR